MKPSKKLYLFQENKNQILASKKSLKIDSDTHCWLKVGLVLRFDLWLRVGVISFMYTLSLYSLLMTQSIGLCSIMAWSRLNSILKVFL